MAGTRMSPQVGSLLERDTEAAWASDRLERAFEGEGSAILIEGPPGIGKTALLAAIRERAAERGMQLLDATGGEMEGSLAYGVVRQLLEPVLRESAERDALFDGAAALAAPALTLDGPGAHGEPADRLATFHGLYWLLSNLAERTPLFIEVDDAHWSDDVSLGFLHYLVRRLGDTPIVLALTLRPTELEPEAGVTISRIAAEPAARTLRLGPLSGDATRTLVRSLLSADADISFCDACRDATAGNPFLIHELAREIKAEGIHASAAAAPRVARIVPEGVARAVFLRLARLPPAAVALARAVAILGGRVRVPDARTLAKIDETTAAEAVDALVAADILLPDRPLDFVHPLVREAITQELPPGERALAHARAAWVLHASGAPPERVASHLLASEPNEEAWRVDALHDAARAALRRGAPDIAATHLRRALAEPPVPERRLELLTDLGRAAALAGDPKAAEPLRAAMELTPDPVLRARLALDFARAGGMAGGDPAGAFEILDEVKAELRAEDERLALDVEAAMIASARVIAPTRPVAMQRLARHRWRRSPGRCPSSLLLAHLAMEALESGEPADTAVEMAQRALADGTLIEQGWHVSWATSVLIWADRSDEARHALETFLERARSRGSAIEFVFASLFLGHLLQRQGALPEAEAHIQDAAESFPDSDPHIGIGFMSAWLAEILLDQGEHERAAAVLGDERALAHPVPTPGVLFARGRLHAHRGSLHEARDDFIASAEWLAGVGRDRCPAILTWRSELALVYAALGEEADAKQLSAEEVAMARAQGAPRALGIALRAHGLVEGDDHGLSHLREAEAVLKDSSARLEHARALIDLGAAVRRSGKRRDAREPLRRGLDLAHHCGASVLAERAREELLAAGARPRRHVLTGVDALTASERRVAGMAADGLSNRQIAQALFLSMGTVATHLTRVYQKLGIPGRSELADILRSPKT